METKRLILATTLSVAVMFLWYTVIVPWIDPPKPRPVADKEGKNAAAKVDPDAASDDESDPQESGEVPVVRPDVAKNETEAQDENEEPARKNSKSTNPVEDKEQPNNKKKSKLPSHPARVIELGSADFESGFRQLVTVNSQGAAIDQITMVDPRLVSLKKPHAPLVMLGVDSIKPRSLEIEVPQLRGNLRKLNWDVVELLPKEPPYSSVIFQIVIDGVQIRRRYEVKKADPQSARPEAAAYGLDFTTEFTNLTEEKKTLQYALQGPTGLVLENEENTSKYRDVVVGFLNSPTSVEYAYWDAKSIANGKTEQWQRPMHYIGIDSQYFAALIYPGGDQIAKPTFESVRQELIGRKNEALVQASEISVLLKSMPIVLEPADEGDGSNQVVHSSTLFAGPKRDEVLPPMSERVIDFGSFLGMGRGMISFTARQLMKLLVGIQSLTGSWGIAIMCLTILVRSVMVPISIKQAQNAARMQTIAPKLAQLKEKFKDDPQRLWKEQAQLYRKHNIRPFRMGCLPALLQMPIFIGLYQSLNNAVDLRMAPFLYIDNLAAPDALFPLPFTVPFLGWKEFNLLPVIVFCLFLLQTKLFTPPPANEEQAVQQKTMSFMMIFMLVMFYRVPAGLCVYFTVSNLWGICEKLLLPKTKAGEPLPAAGGAVKVVEPQVIAPEPRRSSGKSQEVEEMPRGSIWSMFDAIVKSAEKPDSSGRDRGDKKR